MPDKKTADKSQKKIEGSNKEKPVVFKCKFCGETKPLSEMVVLRRYYPQLSACQDCASGTNKSVESYEHQAQIIKGEIIKKKG